MKLNELRELRECPEWLKSNDIIVENEDIILDENNFVIWKLGTWKKGTWEYGIWERGVWENGLWKEGTWQSGNWENGTWESGRWEYGTWYSGTWKNGIWKDGFWLNGTWEGGIQEKPRCKWRISYNMQNKTVEIGCKTKTIQEWDEWFASDETFQTPRNTEVFNNIYKSYLIAKYSIELGNK